MFKIIFTIILFLTLGVLFRPYVVDLFSYFNVGLDYLVTIFSYIIDILAFLLNSLANHYYILLLFIILCSIAICSYLLSYFGGDK